MNEDLLPDLVLTPTVLRELRIGPAELRRRRRRAEVARIWRGRYLPAVAGQLLARERVAATLSPHAVLSGASAARVHGLSVPDRWAQEITVAEAGARVRRRPDLVVRARSLPADEVTCIRGLRLTTLERTVADLLASPHEPESVWVLDQALRRQVLVADISRCLLRGQRGVRRARRLLALGDPFSESPLESAVRLVLADSGVPTPTTQCRIEGEAGDFVARVDFAWPDRRVVLEADGIGFHADPTALHRDRSRQNALALLGWTTLRCTWRDVRTESGALVATVTRALSHRTP